MSRQPESPAASDPPPSALLWLLADLNGQQRVIKIKDKRADVKTVTRPKADKNVPGSIGSPMPGLVVEVRP